MAEQTYDLRDVMLEAQAEVQEIMREVQQEIAIPLMMEQFKLQWTQMPSAMKEQFARERPQEYATLMEMMQ
jgi:hypothetical protein